MDPVCKYLVLSLPQSTDSKEWLERSLLDGKCQAIDFKVPDFQIGTLDSLVQESEELAKFDTQLGTSVAKIVDILAGVLESQASIRTVNSKSVLSYIEAFSWNTSKYRLDKSIKELVQLISSEALTLDNDVRTSYQTYQNAKSNFLAADRKKNGDLSIKSLHDIVKPEDFVIGSENLTTILVAVPKNLDDDFKKSYETLTQFVIPRSAKLITFDSEYKLYSVSLFKKYEQEFINGAREKKWQPRTDFTYDEEVLNNMRKEFDLTRANEQKSKNDLIRLAKTAYSDIISAWFHIKAIRCYVESVLRYGLPPQFDLSFIKFTPNNFGSIDKAKKELVAKFGYLGGDAISNKSSLHEYASLVDPDYEPFVVYQVEIV
ncbi:Vacuolar ATP synthase subunit C [Yamadazyma tenuis]|uniref:V-type proton ATPase subunit C n=1 Tax=Candida tenuis (strain ATCC 10573 / BCRC 21748 / CBS 615 / JCM 9827 / NBRC 10315 / NRRL Y-1498 / VKM Y-70) TaxID=590646 RepID=G3BCW2_CANTC|nr:ATPase, V1 complex, subunit C [Yamadazyma tenuis ATCC 10573]EGV60223.1 ATPase, V1 complex, subunit C [Yamadazyma tenuis ATCC 10573]WEJ94537.1 Vacuolar ATP synthase subunit C [Yamadazyma tenuis]